MEGHHVTGNIDDVFFVLESETPFSNFAERLSIILQNASKYFCRTRLSIFTDSFLQTIFQYFSEHSSIAVQKNSQHVFRTSFSIFAEHI